MKEIITDLKAEHEVLDRFLSSLAEEQWELPTPAEGWTIKDSVSHLAFWDEASILIISGDTTPLEEVTRVGFGNDRLDTRRGRSMKPQELLLWWRKVRAIMADELLKCDPRKRIPWMALPMGARSFATARLMETWAHGLDGFDAVGAQAEDTDRLRHIARLAYMARPYAYQVNGLEFPGTPLRLELWLPSVTFWSLGPEDAKDLIRGKASDFCRVAVRRMHWKDANLVIQGSEAQRFIEIVQAYAGRPGPGQKPKSSRAY